MLLYGAEVVYRDGMAVGDIRAASFGHTLNAAVGLVRVEARDENVFSYYRRCFRLCSLTYLVHIIVVYYCRRMCFLPVQCALVRQVMVFFFLFFLTVQCVLVL